jgi:hypothetical protein
MVVDVEEILSVLWKPIRADRWPKPGRTILAILKRFESTSRIYAVLKVVDEDDCSFRTVDDNSELSHNYSVTHWIYLPKLRKL